MLQCLCSSSSSSSAVHLLSNCSSAIGHIVSTRNRSLHLSNGGGGCFMKGQVRVVLSDFSRSRSSSMKICAGFAATASPMLQDIGATVLVLGGAYSLVLAFDVLTKNNLLDQKLSRKIVHILSGLLFMSSWPLFSKSTEARFFAAIVPVLNCLRLVLYGLSIASDDSLINSISREGKPEELLRGPLYYVLMLLFCVLVFWRDSPVGLVSLTMMSAGDGFADVMGRNFGAVKLPYNNCKSWVGSISMFVFGSLLSILMLFCYSSVGFLDLDWSKVMEKVALVSLAATVVESLPVTHALDDNFSVPVSSMVVGLVVFGYNFPN